jgi:predicted alpha/beta superfamily hydrolase
LLAPEDAPPIVAAMLKRALLITWLGLQCLPTLAQAQDVETLLAAAGTRIQAGTSFTLHSTVLADDREINIWLPPDYARGEGSYTVLYLLDGGLDQDFHHIAGLAQLGSLSWTFGPLIVVGVQTENRRAELTARPTDARYLSAFPESGGAEQFRRFLELEVMPFVEERIGAGGRRAVMGESLAGLFVIDTLLSQPGLFDDYVAISPSLWWDDRRPLQYADARLAEGEAMGRRLYVAMADEGGTMQDGVDILGRALADVPEAKIAWRYADHSATATHATIYHRAAEEALRWLYPTPPYDVGPTPWYMIEGAAPPATSPTR